MTNSNIIRIDAAAAVKAARDAGNAEHGSRSALAFALEGVIQQAYEGNLDPAIVIADRWTEEARKAASTILRHFTNGDLSIKAKTDKFKGASLAKGWADRKVDWDIVGLTAAIWDTCPATRDGKPVKARASIYAVAKTLRNPKTRTDDLSKIEKRTIKAVTDLDLPGIPAELATKLIAETFASIAGASKAFMAKADSEAEQAKTKADAAKGTVTRRKTRKTRKAA